MQCCLRYKRLEYAYTFGVICVCLNHLSVVMHYVNTLFIKSFFIIHSLVQSATRVHVHLLIYLFNILIILFIHSFFILFFLFSCLTFFLLLIEQLTCTKQCQGYVRKVINTSNVSEK